jgi:hypothetical protein
MELSRTDNPVDAGSFAAWLGNMRAVLRGEQAADVPCGDCVGCCVSSYPIPLRPSDHVALEQVPAEHLHLPADPARGLARMGFREDGSCPMLCAGRCSIYSDRPQTCRDYDCRIYAAAGVLPDGERPIIAARVRAWRFEVLTPEDAAAAGAVRRAAQFIRTHSALFPMEMRVSSATAAAVLAVKTYELFLGVADGDSSASPSVQCVIDSVWTFNKTMSGPD